MKTCDDRCRTLDLLVEIAAIEYGTRATEEVNSKSSSCYDDSLNSKETTKKLDSSPRVYSSPPSSNWELMMLAYVATMPEDEIPKPRDEENARIFVYIPRKMRTQQSHHRSSSMATTPWTRAIEKQKKREEGEEEERSLKRLKIIRSFEVGSSSSSSITQNPSTLGLDSFPSSCVTECKKRKTVRRLDVEPSHTTPPEWLVEVMMREDNGYNPKLIIARKMFKSDIDKGQSRLSLPLNQMANTDFLTEEEATTIHQQSVLKSRKKGASMVLVDPLMNKHDLDLRMWTMGGNWNFVFAGGWNNVVAANRFNVHEVYHVWSFRSGGGKLCFALVTPPPPPMTNSGNGVSASGESGHGCSPTGVSLCS
ncbi:unnamed protein product [Microthlaspi erraticum]|uniref:TF-B3 domain-containing protein n=1 Tax=Microthlaspi erraticum TaxID=1685480 RepID=A0A6D2IJR2_9BRAS|nr:unnamed protein product [Microthlaspi erraticum]